MDVLFDLDGVLVESCRFRGILATDFGISAEMTRPFFYGRFNLCATGKAALFEELPPFLESWAWPGSPREFVDMWFAADSMVKPDVLDFASDLRARGLRCHIASNQEKHRALYIAETMGFGARFDSLFFSHALGAQKPAAEYYERIEARLGLRGAELLFIDDNRDNVDAAARRGWHTVHFVGLESIEEVVRRLDALA